MVKLASFEGNFCDNKVTMQYISAVLQRQVLKQQRNLHTKASYSDKTTQFARGLTIIVSPRQAQYQISRHFQSSNIRLKFGHVCYPDLFAKKAIFPHQDAFADLL